MDTQTLQTIVKLGSLDWRIVAVVVLILFLALGGWRVIWPLVVMALRIALIGLAVLAVWVIVFNGWPTVSAILGGLR